MKLAMLTGAVLLVAAGAIFSLVAGALYVAYTDPLCTEFGPLVVLMTLPSSLGIALAWLGLSLLDPNPPADPPPDR